MCIGSMIMSPPSPQLGIFLFEFCPCHITFSGALSWGTSNTIRSDNLSGYLSISDKVVSSMYCKANALGPIFALRSMSISVSKRSGWVDSPGARLRSHTQSATSSDSPGRLGSGIRAGYLIIGYDCLSTV